MVIKNSDTVFNGLRSDKFVYHSVSLLMLHIKQKQMIVASNTKW